MAGDKVEPMTKNAESKAASSKAGLVPARAPVSPGEASYDDFLDALGQRESSGDYTVVNRLGYLGKYQFGELALIDAGYYTRDGTSTNDWRAGFWTGKGGIDSRAEFLGTPAAQEAAIRDYMELQWSYVRSVWTYEGQVLNGLKITVSGMLAGAHLVGNGNLAKFLRSGGDDVARDANGVAVSDYVAQFGGYETPYLVAHGGAEVITGGSHKDQLFGRGGNDTLSGRLGSDVLTGGIGRDTFDFNVVRESPAGTGRDIIRDFRHEQGDLIDLAGIDADTSANPGNDVFAFIGARQFHGGGGEVRFKAGIVQADVNGDRIADLEIDVKGLTAIQVSDFVL